MLIPDEAEKVQSNVDVAELLKIFYTHGAFNFLLPPCIWISLLHFLKMRTSCSVASAVESLVMLCCFRPFWWYGCKMELKIAGILGIQGYEFAPIYIQAAPPIWLVAAALDLHLSSWGQNQVPIPSTLPASNTGAATLGKAYFLWPCFFLFAFPKRVLCW